jgi:hypothetical protein
MGTWYSLNRYTTLTHDRTHISRHTHANRHKLTHTSVPYACNNITTMYLCTKIIHLH